MAKSTLIRSLYRNTDDFLSKDVTISGWIRTLRASNAFGFIEINDGSFFKNIQVVFDEKLDNFKEISKLPISSSLTVVGTLVATPEAKQPFEIQAKEVIDEYNISEVVLGLPKNMDGTLGFAANRSLKFKKLLENTGVIVHLVDERLTTKSAIDMMHEINKTEKNSKNIIDSVSASIILESYLKSIKK